MVWQTRAWYHRRIEIGYCDAHAVANARRGSRETLAWFCCPLSYPFKVTNGRASREVASPSRQLGLFPEHPLMVVNHMGPSPSDALTLGRYVPDANALSPRAIAFCMVTFMEFLMSQRPHSARVRLSLTTTAPAGSQAQTYSTVSPVKGSEGSSMTVPLDLPHRGLSLA